MKTKPKALGFVVLIAGLLVMGSPLFAHHGDAAYSKTPVVLKNAVVTEYDWINPHSLIKVDVKDEKGNVQHWTMEIGSPPSMTLLGWSRTTLKPGDVVTVYVFPSKTGAKVGRVNRLILADGTELGDRAKSSPSRYGSGGSGRK
jgi:Family of unknown function (DUF6152)